MRHRSQPFDWSTAQLPTVYDGEYHTTPGGAVPSSIGRPTKRAPLTNVKSWESSRRDVRNAEPFGTCYNIPTTAVETPGMKKSAQGVVVYLVVYSPSYLPAGIYDTELSECFIGQHTHAYDIRTCLHPFSLFGTLTPPGPA